MKLLGRAELERLDTHLAQLLQSLPFNGAVAALRQPLQSFVLGGGKRMRPQLCLWTHHRLISPASGRMLSPPCVSEPLFDLACAWELFHAFLLIHDDLIDAADTRRDRRSLHREFQARDGNCAQFGRNLALVAGDLLFSEAMRLFHDVDLPASIYRDQLRLFSRVARLTGFGQAIDICQSHVALAEMCEQTLLREYHWKTAAYTFEGPMLTGAIAAGASGEVQAALSRFALALGQAYQMQNDLADLSQPAHEGCDLVQGKRTITLLRFRKSLDPAQRETFDRRFTAIPSLNGRAVKEAESIRTEMVSSPAVEETRHMIEQFLEQAGEAATDSSLPSSLTTGLDDLLACLRGSYFAAV